MSFIATIEAELTGVRSRIVALQAEEAELEAALRVFARLGDHSPDVGKKLETKSAPVPSQGGARQPGEGAAGSPSSPAPMKSDEGQPDKSAGPQGSVAPTLADKLRALNTEHPEFTIQEVAAALNETYERVRNNSDAHKIKWGSDAVRSIGLQDRVAELHRQHPDWADEDIAAEIGKSNGYVRATAQRLGLVLPSRRRPPTETSVQPRSPAPTPKPAPKTERPPAPARAPVAVQPSGSGSAVVTKPMARAPRGIRFNLRNEAGLYLHTSCETMTDNRKWAWEGSADQLLACRKKFALARDLAEHAVEKEQQRQVA